MIKKLKKIFRILFPKKIKSLSYIESKLKNFNFKKIIEQNNIFEVTLINDFTVKIRNENHSDSNVFHQIFVQEEYLLVQKLMTLNSGFAKNKIIIDAGANVGYTSVYFSTFFQDASIFAIEPSLENANCFLDNTKNLPNNSKIKLYQNALSHLPNLKFEIDRNFRDGKDWAIATNETETGNIEGISIQQIIKKNELTHISLLKIDIEGAERFIFKAENDLSFLKITEIIALEIHDEFNIRESINALLIKNEFLIFESGELTIGINKKING